MGFEINLQLFSGHGGYSGIRGGSGTRVYEKSGGYIDLKDNPLKYGRKDDMLKGDSRKAIEEFELEKVHADREYSRVVDKNGNVYSERKGDKGSVYIETKPGEDGQTGSHNHPREIGMLGGTFSNADIDSFSTDTKLKTLRATAKEGTYSISKGKNFDGAGLMAYKESERNRLILERKERNRNIKRMYSNGDISEAKAYELQRKSFNKFLVDVHNSLIAGQKTYGYNYTLERPKWRKK